jgi:prepilin-type N-terminal cleavage/methylation domain-containing protein
MCFTMSDPEVGAATGLEKGCHGFTLLEVLLAVTILSVVATVTFMTFSAATSAWQRGTALMDRIHHGDFVINQLVMALRSAYYPEGQGELPAYGFQHIDNGDGPGAQDEISWVKLGGAMVGRDLAYAESPHRVRFFLAENEAGRLSAAVVSWRIDGQPEDFDPDNLEPVFLSSRVQGFNCRAASMLNDAGEIEWEDEWTQTNRLPLAVEVTLYVEPVEPDLPPVELKRIVGLATAGQDWSKPSE